MIVPNKRLMEERIHQDHETTFSHETRNTRQIEDFVVVPIPRQTHPPEHHLGSWLRVKNAQSPTFSTSTLLLTLETMEKEKKRKEKKERAREGNRKRVSEILPPDRASCPSFLQLNGKTGAQKNFKYQGGGDDRVTGSESPKKA